jgi:peptidoglycan hydrolase-like protein with peptidoglycan-binding domain
MKILLYGLIVFGLFAFNINVEAKTVSTSNCISLSYDMRLTSTDAQTAGQVSVLQSFLQAKGYLVATTPKGYFGTMTQAAVIQYQLKTGITPASGYVGSVTRGKIKSDSCGNEEIVKKGPKPTIKKVSSSLPKGSEVYVGGEVQITGKDLAGSSLSTTFVYLGDKKVEVRQASSELIWFVVPEIPLGTYKLYVSNENGKSKTFKLKVIKSQAVISNEIPILTSVKPSKASGEVDITIKGKNLISGSTVTLSRDGQSVYTYTNTKASKNGKSLTFNLNLDLPQNIASKDYKLRVANIMGQSNELDFTIGETKVVQTEDVNDSLDSNTVSQSKPDLIITDIVADKKNKEIYVKYKNIGGAGQGDFTFKMSSPSGYHNGNTAYRFTVPKPNKTQKTGGLTMSVLGVKDNEITKVSATIDWENRVSESDENNNTFSKDLDFSSSPEGDDATPFGEVNTPIVSTNHNNPPVIYSVSSVKGKRDDIISIYGKDLISDRGGSVVSLGGYVWSDPEIISDSLIRFQISGVAIPPPGNYKLIVSNRVNISNQIDFQVE